jgi:PAS domain S-box-containing protein
MAADSPSSHDSPPLDTGSAPAEAQRLREAAAVSEARFRTVFESSPLGILLADSQSYYLDANPAACRMLGYSREELVGLHATDIIHPGEASQIDAALTEIHGRHEHHREWRFRRRDGTDFPVEVVASQMPDGTLLGVLHDLSDRQQIQAVREHLAAIVESSQDGIVATDLEGIVTAWNAGAAAIFGYSAAEMLGTSILRLFLEDRRPEEQAVREAIGRGVRIEPFETVRLTRDGQRIDVSVSASPIRDMTGRIVGTSRILRDITALQARRQAEQRVRDERRFTDTMIESMPGILYFYDISGRFLRWNRTFEIVSGYTAAEIVQMHPREFFRGEDQQRVEERITEVFARGESWLEADFLAKDGTTTPYFFTGRRIVFEGQTCLVGVGIDISDRRRAEARLAESERKYRELVEHANSIILRWNSEGRITFLNEFGLRFFGYEPDEILGRHVLETIVPQTESGGRDLRRLMEEICADPAAFEQNVNENVRRNGERVWVAWTNRIVRDAQGRVIEILSIGADITARKQAEAECERRHQAEAADRVKSAFLATMSHELRTPLNSIIGFTGILLQGLAGPLNTEQGKQLDMVRTSARHLLALVNDVLDISKIEAGQLEVACEPFDIGPAVSRVVALVAPQANAKQLTLRVDLPPGLGQLVGDERRFGQILLNLLGNAVKFTERGTVTLSVEQTTAALSAGDATPRPVLRIRVADTGPGIPAADLPLLFQPFRQLETEINRTQEGTGLGLAISRRLTDLMGGQIAADSDRGRGAVFTVTLPLEGPPGC